MLLSECTLEQLLQQKAEQEKTMLESDEFMVEINKARMAEIDRCIAIRKINP